MLAWFGGIEVDLRGAELAADGARLSVHTLFGGIEITTPPGWRIESNMKALFGGVDAPTATGDDPNAPVLTLEGMARLRRRRGCPRAAVAPSSHASVRGRFAALDQCRSSRLSA